MNNNDEGEIHSEIMYTETHSPVSDQPEGFNNMKPQDNLTLAAIIVLGLLGAGVIILLALR